MRIALFSLFAACIYIILNSGTLHHKENPYTLVFLGISFLYVLLALIWSMSGIFAVEANTGTGKIMFRRLYESSTVHAAEIKCYYISSYMARQSTVYGRIIVMKDGKTYELNPANLKEIATIDPFLQSAGIPCRGEVRSRYPFRSKLEK